MIRIIYFLGLFGAGIFLAGCSVDLAKTTAQTDAKVYEIIDDRWNDSLGTKANYRISNEASDPNVIKITAAAFSETGILTMPQAVAIATAANRQYQTEKENLYLTALDQTDIQHLYEPMPFLLSDGGFRKDGSEKGVGIYGDAGFDQLLATGAWVGTNLSLGWIDILSGDFRSGFSSVASAVISQPLLRGAGREVALERLTQAQRNTLYQIRTFNRYRKEFVVSVISDYYRVLQLEDRHINARNNYLALFDTYENLKQRAAAGKVPQHELQQANQDKLKALSEYTQANKNYTNALDDFKMQLALPVDSVFRLDMSELDALRRSVSDSLNMNEQEAIDIALNQRLDLATAADQVIDAQRKVNVAADALRAELNLLGYAQSETPRRTVFGADPGELEETRDRYQLSAQLDLPIDRLFEKNDYRRALITLMQQQRAHQELTDQVVLEVRKFYRQVQEAYQRYHVEQSARQLAQKRTQNTILLQKYGRANTRDVLDARDDLLEAQDAETAAMVEYAIACLDFYRDTGTMKVRPDGMWEKSLPSEIHLTAINNTEVPVTAGY